MDTAPQPGRTDATQRRHPWRPPTEPGGAVREVLILATALILAFGFLEVFRTLFYPLLLLLAAVVVATAVAPVAGWLERWLPRVAAVLAVYLLTLLVAAGIGWLIIPALVAQATLFVMAAPELLARGERLINRWDLPVDGQVTEVVLGRLDRFGGLLVALPLTLLSVSLDLFLVLGMSAYLVLAGPALLAFLRSLFPAERRDAVMDVLGAMGQTMGGYVRGTLLDGLIVAVITYVALRVIGVDFPLVLALIAFVGELIPVLGPILAGVPAVGIALTDSWATALVVLGFYVALQQFENYVLLPNIMRRQAEIPPLLTLFALLAGGAAAGIFGGLLAIPLSAALRVLMLRVLAPAIRRWMGAVPEEVPEPEANTPPPRPPRTPRVQ